MRVNVRDRLFNDDSIDQLSDLLPLNRSFAHPGHLHFVAESAR